MTTATESKHGLEVGSPAIKSVGALAFGPDGVLFVADNVSAAIFALDTGDTAEADGEPRPLDIDQLDTRLAAYLGCNREDVLIRSMAVHPGSSNVYLSVMRGGASGIPLIVKIDQDGGFSELALDRLPFSQTTIDDPPAADDPRTDWRRVQGNREGEVMQRRDGGTMQVTRDPFRAITVTDMAYLPRKADYTVHGQLLVAGVSNEEFSS